MSSQPAVQRTAPDPIHVDAGHYTVEMEDERVRVVRVRYGPHEKSVMHSHPGLVAVFLTGGLFRMTYPDGRSEEITVNAGQTLSFPPVEHLPENLTDQTLELVLIELKG